MLGDWSLVSFSDYAANFLAKDQVLNGSKNALHADAPLTVEIRTSICSSLSSNEDGNSMIIVGNAQINVGNSKIKVGNSKIKVGNFKINVDNSKIKEGKTKNIISTTLLRDIRHDCVEGNHTPCLTSYIILNIFLRGE